ncbi:MAG TPA: efflux RND transporter permease subunit, partial [Isosphaeraceae bacterium]|nr:efflux RND transporter permease subunit [Isosphaeraceae bacterium]
SISVGILIDQAVVMGENAAHHLTRHFGRRRVSGDTTEIVIAACRTVGRPIFFSVLITILSFLPVFALTGREGKLFHPLAYTKTFALLGVALLSITLVPALIPIFLKGRIKSEDESWLVRTMIAIFKPMLAWLMDRTTLVCWLFVVIVGLGYVASTKLGREFMPDLDEGSIMDMPTTVPRASVAQSGDDLRVRDAVLRGFPEVWQVVGKAGRAETATDPSPLDMIETVVNLRDRAAWPKRKLRFDDALAQTRDVLGALEANGVLRRLDPHERKGLVNEATMTVTTRVDEALRALAVLRLAEFRPELGRALVGEAIDALLGRVEPSAIARMPGAAERGSLIEALAKVYGDRLALEPLPDDAAALVRDAARRLVALGVLRDRPSLLNPAPRPLERAAEVAEDLLGRPRPTLLGRIADHLAAEHLRRLEARTKQLDWELFDRAVGAATWMALDALTKLGAQRELTRREPTPDELRSLRAGLEKPFADALLLWKKTKGDLVEEMSTALQMPGWGNSFTQPIANRI